MERSPVDHVAEAIAYAQEVVAGLIPAGKWVKAACRRQLDDLERARTDPDWPYEWRPDLADRVIRFKELWPHVKDGFGWRAGERIRLERWQKFKHACVFGWVRRGTSLRRFRVVYEEIARKNAKTTDLATTGLYLLSADGEFGAEVYSAAQKEDQARIVFDIASRMAQSEPEFRARFSVRVYIKAIVAQELGGKFVPLAASDALDGLNTHGALVDELHAHKKRVVHDVLGSSTGSRAQSLIWEITTAGTDRAGVCYDQRTYATKVLNSVLKRHDGLGYRVTGECADDETLFAIIYTIDEQDDPFDEMNWPKANPNLGVSVDLEEMRRMAAQARVQAAALGEFLTKKLCVWVNADSAWMNMLQWDACGDPGLKIEDFAKDECIAALDAAFKKDLFAKVRLFRRLVGDKPHYYAFGRYYTHEALVQEKGNEHLQAWVHEGWIRTTPGNVLDIEAVRQELLEDTRGHQLIEVPFDPAQLTQFATEMIEQGLPMVEQRPLTLPFSQAMKEVEELVVAKRFHHPVDPVLGWAIANVVCHRDARDNIYPRKDDPNKKIDPAIALFMAMARWLPRKPSGGPDEWLKNTVTA